MLSCDLPPPIDRLRTLHFHETNNTDHELVLLKHQGKTEKTFTNITTFILIMLTNL